MWKNALFCTVKEREKIFLDPSLYRDLHQTLIRSILGRDPSSNCHRNPFCIFCVILQRYKPTIQLTNGHRRKHNLLGESSKKKMNQWGLWSSPVWLLELCWCWEFSLNAHVYDDFMNITFYVLCNHLKRQVRSFTLSRNVCFYVFLIFWCRAGSSLLLSPVHHVALRTAGIVDPGLLTLAKTPHISEFSGIS